jgi:drug/metabolite transporter (DMT)-like permease
MAGTIYGLLFFHQPMTWISGIGVILILGSVVALGLGSDSKKEKKET